MAPATSCTVLGLAEKENHEPLCTYLFLLADIVDKKVTVYTSEFQSAGKQFSTSE